MNAIWGKGLSEEMNVTLGFLLDMGERKQGLIKIAASTCYKVYADGKILAFGPQRAAHGFARVAEIPFTGKVIVVEVESSNVESYCWIKQEPFFACEVACNDGKEYHAEDFACRRLTDRVQKVQRYSFQRAFAEVYRLKTDRTRFYRGEACFEPLETEEVKIPQLLVSHVQNARLALHFPVKEIESGRVETDENAPVWRDRAHTVIGSILQGFKIEEWEESATDEVSKFVYLPNESEKSGLKYTTWDFGRAITGFTELKIRAKRPGVVYVVFDELLWEEAGKGKNYVDFKRNGCSGVHKWTVENAGVFRVASFEPYTVRYACVVYTDGLEVEISQRDYENPDCGKLRFSSDDGQVNAIIEAARATLAQNAVDLLTDCPSRERAGWLSDSWFSSVAERFFTGDNAAERAFLENYVHASKKGLPEGMIPMCYPSDNVDGTFIPNWTMWYILELEKYAEQYGCEGIVADSEENVRGILGYFEKKENEEGLLENLESWIFVEWSEANSPSHVCGVNIPSNICYAACLEAAGKVYANEEWKRKAERIREAVKRLAYDGEFFVDNLVRDETGALVRTGYLTEVCQYYAFWFKCATKEEYPELFEELMKRLGPAREEGFLPEMEKPNVMYGLYMRLDLLMREGERKKVLKECFDIFGKMAQRTGTLWENNNISASCDHGFASYAARWLVYALTGYDIIKGGAAAKEGIGIDCTLSLPAKDGRRLRIDVRDNRVHVYRPLAHVRAVKL